MRSLYQSVRTLCRVGAFGAATAASAASAAGLVSIHDGGPTVPIAPYVASFIAQQPMPIASAQPAQAGSLPLQFPVRTDSMRPGVLRSPLRLGTSMWLDAPMFIVGDDPQSRQWLATHREKLRRLGASGLVVNVGSIEAFRSLRSAALDVPMAPGSAEELARQAGLSVYPLFVSTDGRVTQMVP